MTEEAKEEREFVCVDLDQATAIIIKAKTLRDAATVSFQGTTDVNTIKVFDLKRATRFVRVSVAERG